MVAAEKSAHFARNVADDDRDEDDWNAFARLGGVVALRSCVYFGLQAFIPLWFIHQLGTGEGAGNAALTAMLVAGAVGNLLRAGASSTASGAGASSSARRSSPSPCSSRSCSRPAR